MKNKANNGIAKFVSDKTDMPLSSLANIPFIEISGKNYIEIEGVSKINEYNSSCLRLEFKNNQIFLYGNDIEIEYFAKKNMAVKGNFTNVELN